MHIQMTRLYEAAKILRGLGSQSEIARAMNMSSQTINNWEARGISKPGMLAAQAVFGCSANWLDTGEGEMLVARGDPAFPGAIRVVQFDDDSPDLYRIPKVKLKLQAGVTGFQTEPDPTDGGTMGLPRAWVERRGFNPNHLVGIDVKGESMEPTFFEGDTVVVNLLDKQLVDNGVFAVNYEGEAIVKRMTRDAGQWWLSSDNSDQRKFYRRACLGQDCIVIGRVVRREGEHF